MEWVRAADWPRMPDRPNAGDSCGSRLGLCRALQRCAEDDCGPYTTWRIHRETHRGSCVGLGYKSLDIIITLRRF